MTRGILSDQQEQALQTIRQEIEDSYVPQTPAARQVLNIYGKESLLKAERALDAALRIENLAYIRNLVEQFTRKGSLAAIDFLIAEDPDL